MGSKVKTIGMYYTIFHIILIIIGLSLPISSFYNDILYGAINTLLIHIIGIYLYLLYKRNTMYSNKKFLYTPNKLNYTIVFIDIIIYILYMC